jgi:4'-phosphopantetheinyl transferase EntD
MVLSLFTPDVRLSSANLTSDPLPLLFDIEKHASLRFSAKRLREFAIGRDCARQAMRALNHEPVGIPQAHDRAPSWPPGIVGSISHSPSWCLAAAARVSAGYLSLGIDIEPLAPLPEDIEAIVLCRAEQDWVLSQPTSFRYLLGRLIFSVKECAYKCQYPLSGRVLDFQAMEIRIDWAGRTFLAEFKVDAPPFRQRDIIRGRFELENGHFICGAAMRSRKSVDAIEPCVSAASFSSIRQSTLEASL